MRFFEFVDNVEIPDRWFLNGLFDSNGIELDSRELTYGMPLDSGPPIKLSTYDHYAKVEVAEPLRVALRRPGKMLDVTFADGDVPVVTARVAELLSRIAANDFQSFPVSVDGGGDDFRLINVVSRKDCIDRDRSEAMWWTSSDERPDKIGKPRMITRLAVNADRVGDCHIIRPFGWEIVIVVSEFIKANLEAANASGVRFKEVS